MILVTLIFLKKLKNYRTIKTKSELKLNNKDPSSLIIAIEYLLVKSTRLLIIPGRDNGEI